MKKNILIFFIIILSSFIEIKADNFTDYIISGKVIDSKTSEPIAYVNIGIAGKIGTITDFDGNFTISVPEKYTNEMFIVSYVGYETTNFFVSQNLNKTDVVIKLVAKEYNIKEVEIVAKSLFPYTVVKNASLNIYENFYQAPFNYIFTYSENEYEKNKVSKSREYVVKYFDGQGYEHGNEVSYFKNTGYKFLTVKRNFEVSSLKDGYVNIDDILKSDIARFSDNILDIEYVNDYDLQLKREKLNGDSVYIITYICQNPSFLNTGDVYITSYSGVLTVNSTDYSVIKNTITATTSNISSLGKSFYSEKLTTGIIYNDIKYTTTTEYQKSDNKNYLKSIEYTLNFSEKNKNKVVEKKVVKKLEVKEVETLNYEKISTRQYFENLQLDNEIYKKYFK